MTQADTSSVPSHPLIESDHIEGTAVYDANGKQDWNHQASRHRESQRPCCLCRQRVWRLPGLGGRDPYDPVGAAALRHRSAWVQNQHRGGAAAQSARVLPG